MSNFADPAIIAALAGFITAIGAWVSKRTEVAKGRQDIFQVELGALREEVDRLRDDLKQRDTDARSNHHEILELRKQVSLLQTQVLALSRGIHVLSDQLEAAGITPLFVAPATVSTTPSPQGKQ